MTYIASSSVTEYPVKQQVINMGSQSLNKTSWRSVTRLVEDTNIHLLYFIYYHVCLISAQFSRGKLMLKTQLKKEQDQFMTWWVT